MASNIVTHLADDDGVFETLRGLRLLRDAGAITAPHYRRGFTILNGAAGKRCLCGSIPAVVTLPDGVTMLCAACWEAAR